MSLLIPLICLAFSAPLLAQREATTVPMSTSVCDASLKCSITLAEAERLVLLTNPRITASHLLALAAGQVTRQTKSATLPAVNGDLTSVEAEDGSRVGAGSLGSSRLYKHLGAGISASQLIADFGHTHQLVVMDRLRQQAQDQSALAVKQDVLFEADSAFYRLLASQALLEIAKAEFEARREFQALVRDPTRKVSANPLELSIVAVDLSQAELLLADAENEVDSANATLSEVMTGKQDVLYLAVEDMGALPPPPDSGNVSALVAEAQSQRSDMQALVLNTRAYSALERAQQLERMPVISALAIGGVTKGAKGIFVPQWYAAGGVNVSVPLFVGSRISAQAQEAHFEGLAKSKQAETLSNTIARDVRTAMLNAQAAFKRTTLTDQLRAAASQQLTITRSRFTDDAGTIEELRQAQIQSTQAAISVVNARYDYLIALRRIDYAHGSMTPR